MNNLLRKKLLRSTMMGLLCITLSSCGLHLRQPSDLPPELHHITLNNNNVNGAITTLLQRQLAASKVSLNDPDAPLTLTLSNSKMNTEMPIIFNANADTSYTYTLSVDAKLTTLDGSTIIKRHVTASKTILHNVNQVSPPVFTPLMRRTLTQQLVNNIYELLTSQKTITAINSQHYHDHHQSGSV